MDGNIIDEILQKEDISYEDRVRYKSMGRPTPLLQITETGISRGKEYTRSFQESSYETWGWLVGCNWMLFCFPCLLFKVRGPSTDSWTSGFKNISRIKEKCDKHAKSKSHRTNYISLNFLGTRTIQRSLSAAYDKSIIEHNIKVDKNRAILRHILEVIIFCGQYELPLRGDETESSNNRGVFNGLVYFIARTNPVLADHLRQGGGRGKATYIYNAEWIAGMLLQCLPGRSY